MAKKQLRTVKKSGQTGRLNRAEVRSAVITVRDRSTGFKVDGDTGSGSSKSQHSGGASETAAGRKR